MPPAWLAGMIRASRPAPEVRPASPVTPLLCGDERHRSASHVSPSRQPLPPAPRAIASAATAALTAAAAEDAAAFQQAAQRLAALDPEQVGLVLGAVVRTLLENSHAAGLTGDDMLDVVARCATANAGWFPALDADVLVVLLAGSLGIQTGDDEPRPISPLEMSSHASLLIATLLGPAPGRAFHAHLDAAFREIARSETVEMP